MIDIGANLTSKKLKHNLPTILKRAKDSKVENIIITGTSLKGSEEALQISKKYGSLMKMYATAGVHPHNAKEWNKEVQERIESLLKDEQVVAVGECGLDYDRNFSTKEEQLHAFEEQIKLAIKYKKPLFLHERDAFEDFVATLKKYPEVLPHAVVHCFTSKKEHLEVYLEMGMMIGITGWIADNKRGTDLQEAIKILPLDKLMIETDAPFLTPKNMEKYERINEPKNLQYVVKGISQHTSYSEKEIIEKSVENTKRFFGLK